MLKEKLAIGLLLLQIACKRYICVEIELRSKQKIMGEGAIHPLRFMKRPFQSCERRSWLTCDVTCFEVWRQPSHNVKQTVTPNSLMLSLLIIFLITIFCLLRKNFVYWNWIVLLDSKFNFQIKRLNLFNRSLIWSNVCWSLTHRKTN